jgi:hypothetical protein
LETKLNEGIRSTIQNTSSLNDVFSKLGVDIKSKNAEELFEVLQSGAQNATKEVEKAQEELNKL